MLEERFHHPPKNRTKRKKVLVADDFYANRKILQLVLENMDCDVTCVKNGEEAFHYSTLHRFDLILMDVQMPRLNGISATRLIRDNSKNRNTPIIAITALGLTEVRDECFEAGMNDYYLIPVIIDNMKVILQKYLI